MIFSRNQFFLALLVVLTLPVAVYKLFWIARSTETTGIVWYIGHGNLGSVLGISTYPVIRFKTDRDSVYFNSNVDFAIQPGDRISVRYIKDNPEDACVNNFVCLWGSLMVYFIFPVLVLLILYLTPDRLDPIIPKNARIRVGKRPFIKIIKDQTPD